MLFVAKFSIAATPSSEHKRRRQSPAASLDRVARQAGAVVGANEPRRPIGSIREQRGDSRVYVVPVAREPPPAPSAQDPLILLVKLPEIVEGTAVPNRRPEAGRRPEGVPQQSVRPALGAAPYRGCMITVRLRAPVWNSRRRGMGDWLRHAGTASAQRSVTDSSRPLRLPRSFSLRSS